MLSSLKRNDGNFPDGPVVKNPPWIAEDEVQSLAAEIRSCMPQSVPKKKGGGNKVPRGKIQLIQLSLFANDVEYIEHWKEHIKILR